MHVRLVVMLRVSCASRSFLPHAARSRPIACSTSRFYVFRSTAILSFLSFVAIIPTAGRVCGWRVVSRRMYTHYVVVARRGRTHVSAVTFAVSRDINGELPF